MSGEVGHKRHTKEYMIIFFLLALLTAVEVAVPEFDIAYIWKASSLTLLAFGKAFLVAYYYMHLKDEKKYMSYLAAVPLVAVLYAVVLMLESVYR